MESENLFKIENNYPTPIAATYRRIRILDEDEVVAKHDSLGDMAETIIKFLAIVSLQDLKNFSGLPSYFNTFLQNMLHPSLGHWNEILRMCTSETKDSNQVSLRIKHFYDAKIDESLHEPVNSILVFLKSNMKVKYHKDLLNLLILYRNKIWKGHGSKISIDEYRKILNTLNAVIIYLLNKIEFISEYNLIYIEEINVLPTGEFKHKIRRAKGSQIEPEIFNYSKPLKPNHVYFTFREQEKFFYIDLHPLLVSYSCPDCKSLQFYFFNDFHNNQLEFLSYACGHIIYPDMLPNEIEQFLNVSLTRMESATRVYENFDEEEQTHYLIKTAKLKISTKEYYEALELLQISNSKRSTWEVNFYLALLKIIIGFSLNDVVLHINTCVDLEPDNHDGQMLHKLIINEFPIEKSLQEPTHVQLDKIKKYAQDVLSKEVYSPVVISVYQIFCPRIFRQYSIYFWIILPIILLTIRGYISLYLNWTVSIHEIILKSSFFIFFIPIIFYLSKKASDIYIILSQQITDNAKEYFPQWYQDQIDHIFGRFLSEKSFKYRLNLKDKKNEEYLKLVIVLFVLGFSGSMILTCYEQHDLRFILSQAFDFILIIGICGLGVPIIIRTYLMLKNYSTFSLKPLLSAMDYISLWKIGRIILVVSIPLTILGFNATILGYLTFTTKIILPQLILFYLFIFLGITWTVFTPYYFSKSLRKAKDIIIIKYGKYIEDSFNQFLDNPEAKNFERHKWLIKAQAEIRSIKTSVISIKDLIGILFINLFIIAVGFLAPFFKWNISFQDVLDWFHTVFYNL